MLRGNIYCMTDPNIVMSLAPTHTVICVSGETHNYQQFIQVTNANIATILLPPYESVSAEMDGNMQAFVQTYYNHLMSKEPMGFVSIILRALYNGSNIILFLTKDEAKLNYIKVFIEFMREMYGITIGYDNIPCAFDERYYPVVLTTMFVADLMEPIEYLNAMPDEVAINDPYVLSKLLQLLHPYIAKESNAIDYFASFRKRNKGVQNLIIPIRGV